MNREETVHGITNGFKNFKDAQELSNIMGDEYVIMKVVQQSLMFDEETLAYLVIRKDVEL